MHRHDQVVVGEQSKHASCSAETVTIQEAQDLHLEDERTQAAGYHPEALRQIKDTSRYDEGCIIRIAKCSDPTVITNTVTVEVDFFEVMIRDDMHSHCAGGRGLGVTDACKQFMRECFYKYEPDRNVLSPTWWWGGGSAAKRCTEELCRSSADWHCPHLSP